MKQLVMALILYAIGTLVNAQVRTALPVYCGSTEILLKTLQKEYKEQPVWTAAIEDRTSMYMLMYNDQTLSWTFLQLNETVACVLAAGDEGRPTTLQIK